MKESNINYGIAGDTGNSTDHVREYYSGTVAVKSDVKMILPRIIEAWSKLRKKIKHGLESLKNKLMGPVKPIKNAIVRDSNLLHDYYAINSVDGMNLLTPIPLIPKELIDRF